MNWQNCISDQRTGSSSNISDVGYRHNYQRDFDRLIFSSAFRRLQGKTQVFPLPGNTFVHNRLTHSLETSSVGRSLGEIVGNHISNNVAGLDNRDKEFYKYQLKSVIAAACLAHDVGNPAFGHSGEAAISNYFEKFADKIIEGKKLKDHCTLEEWQDLINFEGNANAIRILSRQYAGKSAGGLRLTYTTLASLLKYPCASNETNKKYKHRKKYGFFRSDQKMFEEIAANTNMIKDDNAEQCYFRHPFVYLTEAADDICYMVIDMEDAHRINILDRVQVENALLSIISEVKGEEEGANLREYCGKIGDDNEAVSFLRAMTINTLVNRGAEIFIANMDDILAGKFTSTLIDVISDDCPSLNKVIQLSIDKIYNHESVVEIEIAGYNVMSELLQMYIPTVLKSNRGTYEKKVLRLMPNQYKTDNTQSSYEKIMLVIDHIAGMTDGYATELYRKVKGIEISQH